MLASVAGGQLKTRRWALALTPVVTAVGLVLVFGLAADGAAGSRSATNPAVAVPRLLTAGDVGVGWTATRAGALAAEPAGCFRPRAQMLGSSPASLVAVLLTGPAGLPVVDELAARYSTSAKALSGYQSLAATLQGCATVVTPAGTADVAPLPLVLKGDRTSAAVVSLGRGDQAGAADFVAAQRGTSLVLVVYGTAGTPDAATAGRLVSTAIQLLGP